MALLQIMDPAQSPRAIGIDLGTTHSLVAWVTPTGAPTALFDCDNDPLVPSAVHYSNDGGVLVGKPALAKAVSHPSDTILSAKRLMGRGMDDPGIEALHSYKFASETGPVVRFQVATREVTPVEVSAEILRELRTMAVDAIGDVGGAVITVPAYFDDAQRQATKDAATLAGFEPVRLLNEPTAAALAYGLQEKRSGTFVVYDLGGGTFDVTVLDLDDGVFQVRSTGGDSQLGGDDMDRAVVELVLAKLGLDAKELTPSQFQSVKKAARQIKHGLSDADVVEASIELPEMVPRVLRLHREEFESAILPLVKRTEKAAKRALRDAKLAPADIDGVILVGGATRTPLVRSAVESMFGKPPLKGIDPDQVVALGAAEQADMLFGEGVREEVLLLDVLPLSLGVETMGGVVEKILQRNTPIPASAAQVFTTYADEQTGFELHVLQGERELAEDCRSLAQFTLKGIPPMAAGIARLEVRFQVDADGILEVFAKEQRTGIEQSVEVKPSYGLTEEQVEEMLLEAYEHGEADVLERLLRQKRVEASRVLSALETALSKDAELLIPGEESKIRDCVAALGEAVSGTDHRAIEAKIQTLDDVSKPFAGRRMDRSIKAALSGRDLSEVESETAHAEGIESHLGPEAESGSVSETGSVSNTGSVSKTEGGA